jgi:DNA-binding SARP family transcriptional activator
MLYSFSSQQHRPSCIHFAQTSKEAASRLEVRLLGRFEVKLDGRTVPLPSRPAQSLFAYLALSPGTAHRREKLAGLLWPDSSDDNARRNLRQSLWHIRKALSEAAHHYLHSNDMTVAFAAAAFWLDVALLEKPVGAAATPEELMAVVSVYGGELLPGFYDDWVVWQRARQQNLFERKMEQLLDRLTAVHRWDDLLEWGERWLAFGQSPEAAYRALMVAHAGRGDLVRMAAVYRRCVDALENELGVEPSPQTKTLYERLSRGEEGDALAAALFPRRYQLLEEVGRGGMGVVYRAHDTRLARDVAVKMLAPNALDADGRARLLREAQAIARLNHPNIVTVFDTGEVDGRPCIVMELVPGHSLRQHKPQNLDETFSITRQICLALEHKHRVCHAYYRLGSLAFKQKMYTRARPLWMEALANAQEVNAKFYSAVLWISLGELARQLGDYQQATTFYEEGLILAQQINYTGAIASIPIGLGYNALYQEALPQAKVLFKEALILGRKFRDHIAFLAPSLVGMAGVAGKGGQAEQAAQLLGAVTDLLTACNELLDPDDQAEYDRYLGLVRAQLNAVTFTKAWAAGQAMSLDEAIAFALET